MVGVLQILAQQDRQLDRLRKVLRPTEAAASEDVEETGRVMALPVGPHAIAGHHQGGPSFQRDGVPNVHAIAVPGDGYSAHGATQPFERRGRVTHRVVHVFFGQAAPGETLLDDAEPQSTYLTRKRLWVAIRAEPGRLPRIEPVPPGDP